MEPLLCNVKQIKRKFVHLKIKINNWETFVIEKSKKEEN